jgi:hypothetical protein
VLSLLDGRCSLVEDVAVQKILLVGALGERCGGEVSYENCYPWRVQTVP